MGFSYLSQSCWRRLRSFKRQPMVSLVGRCRKRRICTPDANRYRHKIFSAVRWWRSFKLSKHVRVRLTLRCRCNKDTSLAAVDISGKIPCRSITSTSMLHTRRISIRTFTYGHVHNNTYRQPTSRSERESVMILPALGCWLSTAALNQSIRNGIASGKTSASLY